MRIALLNLRDLDPCVPTSLLCLHAFVRARHPDVEVDIIDAGFGDPREAVLRGGYDLVGISAMTAEYEAATEFAWWAKKLDIPIVVGGVHISKLPESLRSCFTVGVMGEGEEPLCDLITLYKRKSHPDPSDFAAIPGLVYRDEWNHIRQTKPRPLNITNYPHLDYSAVSAGYFKRAASAAFGAFGIEAFLMTSRGCPFHCPFCASSHFWHGVRYHSVDWVIQEIKTLVAMGATLIHFGDDLFACHKKRLREIAERIIAEGLHKRIAFGCSGQTGIFDEEMARILVSMNCKNIFFGFESGDPEVLGYLKAGKASVEDNRRVVLLCERYGIDVWGGLIIGSPGETPEQIDHTIEFIEWSKLHGVIRLCVAILYPFPGTPVWDLALQRGEVSLDMNFDELKMNAPRADAGMLVDPEHRPAFAKMRTKAFMAIHSFKWRKARMLFKSSPIETAWFAARSSGAIIKRLLNPLAP